MSSGRTVGGTVKKSYNKAGAKKIRCPRCNEYAVVKLVKGREVYQCPRCKSTFTAS